MLGGTEIEETQSVKVNEEPKFLKYLALPFAVLAAPIKYGADKVAGDPVPAPALPRNDSQAAARAASRRPRPPTTRPRGSRASSCELAQRAARGAAPALARRAPAPAPTRLELRRRARGAAHAARPTPAPAPQSTCARRAAPVSAPPIAMHAAHRCSRLVGRGRRPARSIATATGAPTTGSRARTARSRAKCSTRTSTAGPTARSSDDAACARGGADRRGHQLRSAQVDAWTALRGGQVVGRARRTTTATARSTAWSIYRDGVDHAARARHRTATASATASPTTRTGHASRARSATTTATAAPT